MKRIVAFIPRLGTAATTVVCIALTPLLFASQPALTIYNQNFAVVRDTVPIDLKQGINNVRFTETTAHLEPDSVILRDSTGKTNLQILEQNYRNDPVSQELLLSFFEGKTIDFLVVEPNKPNTIVQGKIVRSGYARHSQEAMQRYGQRYAMAQSAMAYQSGGMSQPIIEVNGKLRFALPGQPLFPPLGDDTILKPTIEWQLQADKAAKLDAELAYVTGGMSWEADYNIVALEKSDLLDFVGWVTMDNQSGKTFENAKIKLMAGDVSKIQQAEVAGYMRNEELAVSAAMPPPVSEKAFEDYHLYTLARPATLRDRETKQVEFIRANGVKADSSNHWLDETFEIKLRNHKKESVDIRVVEHLFRWTNWEIREKSDPFTKMNAQTMEFLVPVKADEEKMIHYTVHYSW